MSSLTETRPPLQPPMATLAHLAAAVDPHPESQDAVALAAALTAALNARSEADLMLTSVEPDLPLIIPGLDWKRVRAQSEGLLTRSRDQWAPEARIRVESDLSVARGLGRFVLEHHRDVMVIGSSRHAPEGHVRMGNHARSLIHELGCTLAIAPRGLARRAPLSFRRIGVGFDGGSQSQLALSVAAQLAQATGARLTVWGVIDDRIPAMGWPQVWLGAIMESWQETMDAEAQTLREQIEAALEVLGVAGEIELGRGRPATELLQASAETDLMVIGSRRWGPLAHLVLGGTGEALTHGALCPLVLVPRSLTPS